MKSGEDALCSEISCSSVAGSLGLLLRLVNNLEPFLLDTALADLPYHNISLIALYHDLYRVSRQSLSGNVGVLLPKES
jgi:hypothetical protein